jgi:putative DNA primase/helicase
MQTTTTTNQLQLQTNNNNNMKSPATTSLIDLYNDAVSILSSEEIYSRYQHDFNSDHNGKLRGKPPFRESKSGQSFTVFPDKGFFDIDFGGSPADYVYSLSVGCWERAKGRDFFNAVKILCEQAGVTIPDREVSQAEIDKAEQWERRRVLLNHVVEFNHGVLISPNGDVARDYLNSRNINNDAINELKIGYCHKSVDLFQYLKSKGFSTDEINITRVCEKKLDKYISFPWLDSFGKILTMYYRYSEEKPPETTPKTPKTYALHGEKTKSHPYLFNSVVKNNHRECIFVEGLFDAVALQLNGETRVCSGIGASFSNDNINQLKRHRIERVYHIGDPDAGGDVGTESNIKRLLDAGIDVYIPERLPDGLDPDEFIARDGIEALTKRIENAEHGLTWMARKIIAKHSNSDSDKIKLIRESKKWIQSRQKVDPVIIEMNYYLVLAKHLGISIDVFKDNVNDNSSHSFDDDFVPEWNQGAISEYLADRYREKLAWNIESQEWYRYEAQHPGIWNTEPSECVKQVINAELKRLAMIHNQFIDNPKNFKTVSYQLISSIEKLMACELGQKKWDFDNKELIPFKNGVLNFKTHKFIEHCPGNRLTWSLPYDYNLMNNCQPIQDWMLEMFGSPEMVKFVRAYLNCIVTSRTDLQSYLELIGPGGTGKSTLIRLAQALVGVQNCHTTSLVKLENDKFETANIYNKKLIVITDSERYGGGVSILKAITGGDSIPFEVKFKQAKGGFTPGAMVLLAANELPQSNDYTTGLSRRRLTVRMDKQIDVLNRRDLIEISGESIKGDFAPFIPGLLNWVLKLDHIEVSAIIKGYSKLAIIESLKAEVLTETNPIAAWVDHCIVFDTDTKTYVGSALPDKSQLSESRYLHIDKWLYASYRNFSESHGNKAVSANRFSPVLFDLLKNQLKLDVKKGRDSKGSYFENIRLRYESDTIPPLITDLMAMTANLTANLTAETPTHDELDGLDGLSEKSVKNFQSGIEKNSITDNGLGGEFSQKSVINPQVRHTGGFEPSGEPSGSHQGAIINDGITDFDALDIGVVLIAKFAELHLITARSSQQWLTHRGEYVSRTAIQNQDFKVPTIWEMVTAIQKVIVHKNSEMAQLLKVSYKNDPNSLFCQAIATDEKLKEIYNL